MSKISVVAESDELNTMSIELTKYISQYFLS